ncbi:hypothetical protein EDEG_03965 [Edhazardia aedis USNM 41457]|uniref:Brix domain-containing protein n=1 Tax=Edhazardia aedis (strain USNM 41457) TaxID=1003232 RepID=J9D0J8_EDHAE|nr:hypothetical protein EDEG_03965 [Edhazardia aedis USNM 41457]|eukprot:EJW01416.1 hypothetical protein EDEG_03965 [Edhazardia aedis USNM 41457]
MDTKIEYKNKFITTHGNTSGKVRKLVEGIRKAFEPSNNRNWQDTAKVPFNKYFQLSEIYKISHFIFLTQTDKGIYFKIVNGFDQGPSYTFKVLNYQLVSQLPSNRRVYAGTYIYGDDPYISVDKSLKLNFINTHEKYPLRTVMLKKEGENYFFRHYYIRKEEDDNVKIRLFEIGPRIEMELYKIENGLFEGGVLFNKYVSKTNEEILANAKRIKEREELRKARREEQERNVLNKKMSMKQKNHNSDSNQSLDSDASKDEY